MLTDTTNQSVFSFKAFFNLLTNSSSITGFSKGLGIVQIGHKHVYDDKKTNGGN